MQNVIKVIAVPDDAELLQIARLAQAQHLHLITNGQRSVLSPVIPAGWTLHGAGIKQRHVGTSMLRKHISGKVELEVRIEHVVKLGSPAHEDDAIAIAGSRDRLVEPDLNIGLESDFHLMDGTFGVVCVHVLRKPCNAPLAGFGNLVFSKITDAYCDGQVLPFYKAVHNYKRNPVNGRQECTGDIHNDSPVIITESIIGLGLPNEVTKHTPIDEWEKIDWSNVHLRVISNPDEAES